MVNSAIKENETPEEPCVLILRPEHLRAFRAMTSIVVFSIVVLVLLLIGVLNQILPIYVSLLQGMHLTLTLPIKVLALFPVYMKPILEIMMLRVIFYLSLTVLVVLASKKVINYLMRKAEKDLLMFVIYEIPVIAGFLVIYLTIVMLIIFYMFLPLFRLFLLSH